MGPSDHDKVPKRAGSNVSVSASDAVTNNPAKRPGPITIRRRVAEKVEKPSSQVGGSSTSRLPSPNPASTSWIAPENRRYVACRFREWSGSKPQSPGDGLPKIASSSVPTDQWLTTHVDMSWTVSIPRMVQLLFTSDPPSRRSDSPRSTSSSAAQTQPPYSLLQSYDQHLLLLLHLLDFWTTTFSAQQPRITSSPRLR